ncbi:MAG: phosphoribosylglycinamide formyltransferase [Cyclobacteriaceae bacterium]
MKKIALFASGSGTNAEKICEHFQNHPSIEVSLLLTNKANAGAIERVEKYDVPTHVFSRPDFYDSSTVIDTLKEQKIDLVVLAGFLWLVPKTLVTAFPNKIINIHPALLPKYGGKGMYGEHVHQAVVENKEAESGITIHYVNEHYDEGNIIFQASCEVISTDTPADVAKKIHQLEHTHFSVEIEKILKG